MGDKTDKSYIANIVLPGKFIPNKDNWENYREQLFFALEASGPLESVQKRALFLSQCGKEAFALIVSLLSPQRPSEVAFDEIVEVLNKFFVPTPHPILETEKFYNRKQRSNESITSFVAALHDISSRCKFSDMPRRVAEQIILGVKDGGLKKELLKIEVTDLTYDKVVQRALNYEAISESNRENYLLARTHCDVTQSNPSTSADVSEPMDVNAVQTKLCVHCARRHANLRCKFRNATCYKCHKKGHTKAACEANSNKTGRTHVNKCDECCSASDGEVSVNGDSAEDNHGIYDRVHGVSGCGAGAARVRPVLVQVTANGVPLVMEVDSGSARAILPHSLYRQHRRAFPAQLTPCKTKLVTWTDDVLKIVGEMIVDVVYNGISVKLPLLVSCGKGPALLGRAWFEPLGISIQGVNSVTEETVDFASRFPQLFDDSMDKYSGPLVHIDCKEGVSPVFLRCRPVPFPLREKVNEQLNKMVADGIISPVKHSRWATPLTIVPKPDGSLRLCGDYRSTVNASCLADSYPLPTSNEAFFALAGGKYFSKVDLKQAYNQLKVDDETAELLTLNTPLGLMRMNRLAYGVNAATAIFQRLMSSLLAGIQGVACLLDDVVVCGSTLQEHNERLLLVLKRLEDLGLKLNRAKCIFSSKRVTFLGYEIDETGVHPSKEKIREISDKPAPSNKKALKAFLGLYNFYERFLKDKTIVLEPLYKLLKENVKWQWGSSEQSAFDKAKSLLTSDLTLVHYSLERELYMLCDASEYGVGAVLVHKMDDGTERPVIMGSRTMQPHERRYAQIDKEALAIMFGLKKFRQYLLGRRFVIFTDHKPLLGIFGRNKPIPELVSNRMLRWALTLNTFDYELKHRPGKNMGNADSLSRWPTPHTSEDHEDDEHDIFLLEQSDIDSKAIAKATDKDQVLKRVKYYLLHGWPNTTEDPEILPYHRRRDYLSLNKNCILWSNRVVIPKVLQGNVLKKLHEGHYGMVQTKMIARAYIWYPSLDNDIEELVALCEKCQLYRNNPPVTGHVWQPTTKPWSRVHIDFMGPFMNKTFLVLVDAYSKWPVIEMVPSMSSKTVVDLLKKIFADFGLPDIVVSDNGLAFTSKEFQDFMSKNRIRHITGAPYHPATNGQIERTIQTIKSKLKKQSPMTWSERVAKVLFHMRTVPSTVTGKTPAEMLNGRKFRTALTPLHPDSDLSENLEIEGEGNQGNPKKTFKTGDHVLFRLYNMNQKWQRGVVTTIDGPAVYEVKTDDGTTHRRHVDQLLRTRLPNTRPDEIQNNDNVDDCETNDNTDVTIPPPEEWAQIIGV